MIHNINLALEWRSCFYVRAIGKVETEVLLNVAAVEVLKSAWKFKPDNCQSSEFPIYTVGLGTS